MNDRPPPAEFWRVEWLAAVGHRYPRDRRQTARNFTRPEYALRQIQIIREMPSHLELTATRYTTVAWRDFDPEILLDDVAIMRRLMRLLREEHDDD